MTSSATTVRFNDTVASALLDLVRGLAAVLVLCGHWRNILFVDYPQLHPQSALAHGGELAMYGASSAGHQAVVIFFVLSGYLISASIFRSQKRNNWNWSLYLLHRIARLWTVLVPGLLLCALWDNVGLHFTHATALYHGMVPNHVVPDVTQHLSFGTFLGNLFFLSPMYSSVFGSDGPLWSLPYEFWYYVLFPLALMALLPQSSWRSRSIHGALFLLVAFFVRGGILEMFPIWLLGTLLASIEAPQVPNAVRWLALVLFVPLMLLAAKWHGIPGMLSDYLFGIVVALFLATLLSARQKAASGAVWVPAARQLSRFSYTLYVVHVPLLILLAGVVLGDRRWDLTTPHLGVAALLLLLLFVYAWAVAAVTEFHTDKVRPWLEMHLLGRSEPKTPHERVLEGKAPVRS